MDSWPLPALLLGATGLHAGFQTTVSTLVYPMLARTPAESWVAVHRRHSRSITPIVAVVYGAVLAACAASLVVSPTPAVVVASAASTAALAATALRAAPLHGRLAAYPDPVLMRQLLRADRVRSIAAIIALVAALVGVWLPA